LKTCQLESKKTYLPACWHCANVASMMFVFANTKGGVGKSTLAVHLAVWLHDRGRKTALLDGDKQGSSSRWIAEVEPEITVVTTDSPEKCLLDAQKLALSHDVVIADGPAGIDDLSRTLLILADLAVLPVTPSILDVRSVQQAADILHYAQGINQGRPEGRLVLNKYRRRDTISRELERAAPKLGVRPAKHVIRDLQAYRDAAQQASVVTRMGRKTAHAADEITTLFQELMRVRIRSPRKVTRKRRVANG